MSLDEYLADIARVPMLTCDEEIILGTRIQEMMQILKSNGLEEQVSQKKIEESIQKLEPQSKNVVRKGLKARSRMISANMRLVVAVVRKVKTGQTHLTTQDMIQEGVIGLARAAEKFEPGRGYKFSTYAYWWIRQAVVRASESQERMIKIPASIQKTARQAKEAKERLVGELGRNPAITEVAREIGEDAEKIKKMLLLDVTVVSLDSKLNREEDGLALLDTISSACQEEEQEEDEDHPRAKFLLTLINALAPDEQELIKQRYGIGCQALSTKEIARINGVSEQAVRQKQQRIANKIRYVAAVFPSQEHFAKLSQ